MDAHDGRLLGPVRREPVLVRRVGLDRRVVRDVDLLEVELGGELGKVPDVEGEVVGGRGEDAAVAAEAEAGHQARVVGEVADEVPVRDVPHCNEMGDTCKIIAITVLLNCASHGARLQPSYKRSPRFVSCRVSLLTEAC